jgi:serine/threonine protein kinase/extradiol dioxygenase family protein
MAHPDPMSDDQLPPGDETIITPRDGASTGPSGSSGSGSGARTAFRLKPEDRVGTMIGPYKVQAVRGQGGFGVVYMAERREPFVQRVALKVIRPGKETDEVIARFEQERQALAMMDHPNIAKVFDGGLTPEGQPYFAMEWVAGLPITEYCDQFKMDMKERLRLFISVCEAVQHAHMKGIIHRDLKPGNILVEVVDDRPVAKVIDFGIAKAISHTGFAKELFTMEGVPLGTPEYMSPEQAEADPLDVDTRTDVYSLGVVMYELISGALPFESQTLRSAGFAAMQRMIREVDPPRPSTRLNPSSAAAATAAKSRGMQLQDLVRALSGELSWIPMKALRKDRTRRYPTALELANDIRNYLDGKPLVAGPESNWYRARKYIWRNKAGAAVVLAVALGMVSVTAISAALWYRASADNQRLRAETVEAQEAAYRARVDAATERTKRASEDLGWLEATFARNPQQAIASFGGLAELQRVAHEDLKSRGSKDAATAAAALAQTLKQLAIVNEVAHDYDAGLAAAGEAIALLEPLAAAKGASIEDRTALAVLLMQRGDLQRKAGRQDDAAASYKASFELRKALVEETGEAPSVVYRLNKGRQRIVEFLMSAGKLDEALAEATTLVQERERLRDRALAPKPGDTPIPSAQADRLTRDAAWAHHWKGTVLEVRNQTDEAAAEYRLFETGVRARLAKQGDADHEAQQDVAVALEDLGRVAALRGDQAAAERLSREGLQHAERAVVRSGGKVAWAKTYLVLLGQATAAMAANGKQDEARELRNAALKTLDTVLEANPPGAEGAEALQGLRTMLPGPER